MIAWVQSKFYNTSGKLHHWAGGLLDIVSVSLSEINFIQQFAKWIINRLTKWDVPKNNILISEASW